MLIQLRKDEPKKTPASQPEKQGPIKVDLAQTKPKRKATASKSTKKEKIVECNLEELRTTIERVFANEDAVLITTQEELLNFLRQQEVFGLDTETTGLKFYQDHIVGYSVGTATRSAYIPLAHKKGTNYQDDINTMCEILLEREYYGFNAKFDWHFLEHFNPMLADINFVGEGSLALRCYNFLLPHELKDVYREVIDPTYEEYSFKKLFGDRGFDEYDPKDVYKYAAVDARKHYVITEYFEKKLQETPDRYQRYKSIELRNLKVVKNAEEYGFCFDAAKAQQLYDELEAQKGPLLETAKQLSGNPDFNPSSPKQVKEAFAAVGFNLTSTNEDALSKIDHPLAKAILDYRGIVKMQGTYTTNLLEFTDVRDGCHILHADFSTLGAATGRMSSSKPNMQNFPRDNNYRNMLIARPGHKLISVDYSQQEVRVIAALADDQTMIDAFKSGKDFYSLMASIVFKLPYEECGKHGVHGAKRNQMKAVVLGLNYSMGIKSLAADLNVSESEAQDIVDKFYAVCPKIKGFQQYCLQFAKEHGYNQTMFGHRRYYEGLGYAAQGLSRFEIFGPGLQSAGLTEEEVMEKLYEFKNNRYKLKEFINELKAPAAKAETKHLAIYVKDREGVGFNEERECTNSVIQGSAAEMTKLAAIVADNDPILKQLNARIVNFIHDEIMIEAPDATAEQAGARLAEIMNDVCADLLDGLPGGAEPDVMSQWRKS